MIKDRTGQIYVFEDGSKMTIIEYFNAKNVTVKFDDGTVMKNVKYYRFVDGKIKNSNKPFVNGVGFIGYGLNVSENGGISNIAYIKWSGIMQRCYVENNKKPTYIGCSVDSEWHNFQNFAKWFEENYIEGFELDKDILVKGNKVYGPETCCFVPREINNIMTYRKSTKRTLPVGVYPIRDRYRVYVNIDGKLKCIGYYLTIEDAFSAYKNKKETLIKEKAEKHKDKISKRCYDSLISWNVEIND